MCVCFVGGAGLGRTLNEEEVRFGESIFHLHIQSYGLFFNNK
jgi:hypothetical protein